MAHREFRDPDGVTWQVWAVVPRSAERRDGPERRADDRPTRGRRVRQELRIRMASELAKGWLVFESAREKRRLLPIPDDWAERSDAALSALLAEATPATHVTRRLVE